MAKSNCVAAGIWALGALGGGLAGGGATGGSLGALGGGIFCSSGFSGGGKTGRKVDEQAYASAKQSKEKLERVLAYLKKVANKDDGDKRAIRRIENIIKKLEDQMRKSEVHARVGQGTSIAVRIWQVRCFLQ